ncbi:MAG: site-specific integrase [Acidobacteriota bacterium]|nr:site-specific integrase [Acidobacteriota bacterium]
MAKERSGSVVKRKPRTKGEKPSWWARVTYIDPVTGKRRDLQRRADSKADAKDRVHDLIKEIDTTDGRTLAHERKTFLDLASYYEKHYLKPAEYIEGRKVAGLRSLEGLNGQLNAARDFFGHRPLRTITYADLADFRSQRLKTPTRGDVARHAAAMQEYEKAAKKKQKAEPPQLRVTRTIATVNRELAQLRRMLNVAQREGWIVRNPLSLGESLISVADEKKRERILTREEETRLLAACDNARRKHLLPIIVCALDTGMRQGEIFSLRWREVDFDNGMITVDAFNTKTMRSRTISLTTRLAKELEAIAAQAPKRPDDLVFGISDNVKRSFYTVRCAAGLEDVRFHDLRHTAATRLVGAHIPLSEVGRVLGHTQANTTYRYVNANIDTARRAAAALDAFNSQAETAQPETDSVN